MIDWVKCLTINIQGYKGNLYDRVYCIDIKHIHHKHLRDKVFPSKMPQSGPAADADEVAVAHTVAVDRATLEISSIMGDFWANMVAVVVVWCKTRDWLQANVVGDVKALTENVSRSAVIHKNRTTILADTFMMTWIDLNCFELTRFELNRCDWIGKKKGERENKTRIFCWNGVFWYLVVDGFSHALSLAGVWFVRLAFGGIPLQWSCIPPSLLGSLGWYENVSHDGFSHITESPFGLVESRSTLQNSEIWVFKIFSTQQSQSHYQCQNQRHSNSVFTGINQYYLLQKYNNIENVHKTLSPCP